MHDDRPSKTAFRVALRRAAHQVLDDPRVFEDPLALAARVAAAGEPFQTFFDPPELEAELRRLGFVSFEDLGTEEINARYFSGRADGLRAGGGIGRLMKARVG